MSYEHVTVSLGFKISGSDESEAARRRRIRWKMRAIQARLALGDILYSPLFSRSETNKRGLRYDRADLA